MSNQPNGPREKLRAWKPGSGPLPQHVVDNLVELKHQGELTQDDAARLKAYFQQQDDDHEHQQHDDHNHQQHGDHNHQQHDDHKHQQHDDHKHQQHDDHKDFESEPSVLTITGP